MIYRLLQIKALSHVPGLNALMGNKIKMIKLVLHSIIERSCFANYTWLGRGAKGQSKQSLQKHPNILQLLYTIVKGCDISYSYDLFLHHLKDKVIKYAYELVSIQLHRFYLSINLQQ